MKLALWGLGRHAFKNVLPAIASTPGIVLAGVCSRSAESLDRASAEYGCRTWSNPREMLDDRGVDAVYVATPIGLHFEHGMEVLRSGHHLVCEKSLVQDPTEARALLSLARERKRVICESLMCRFHPRWAEIVRRARAPQFGSIDSISAEFLLPTLGEPGYRLDPSLGGGAFLDVACYGLAFVLDLISEVPRVSWARIAGRTAGGADTYGSAVLEWAERGRAFVNWGYGSAYRNEATVTGAARSLSAEFIFSKGGPRCTHYITRDDRGAAVIESCADANAFVEMLAYVQKAVSNESMKEMLWSDAGRQAELMQRVRQAARDL